jgi:hypothetical protein
VAYTFDGPNKLIILSSGTTTLDLRDVWSKWVDWFVLSDNAKFLPAFSTVGGDEIDASSGTLIPIYLFLQNGWRVRPYEGNHTLSVIDGILLVPGGGDPFVSTIGNYRVGIRYSQPVQAISFATGGAGSGTSAADILDASEVEVGFSVRQSLKLILSALAGRVSGSPGPTVVIRNAGDTTDRITATVDENGNRTSISYDVS